MHDKHHFMSGQRCRTLLNRVDCTQFTVLFLRTLKVKVRDPMSVFTVIFSVIIIAALQGSIYYKMPIGDWQNRIAGACVALHTWTAAARLSLISCAFITLSVCEFLIFDSLIQE